MSLPRMSLHIGDYRKDTGHLRAAEHGAYLLLIMHYWAKGGLPDGDRQLAAIACMTEREWKRTLPIIQEFFGPGWSHGRIDEELRLAKEKYEKHAAAGRKGGRPIKPLESQAFSKQKQPITNNPKEKKESSSSANGLDDGFGQFWNAYPRKVSKKAAEKAYSKALKHTPLATILAALEKQKPKWARKDIEFTPHPATWLNGGRWEDEVGSGQQGQIEGILY